MFFRKAELLCTYSEENFNEALKVLDEGHIKYETKVVSHEEDGKGKQYYYFIYVRERERENAYKLFRQELEIFAY